MCMRDAYLPFEIIFVSKNGFYTGFILKTRTHAC